ncbi:hypothetical protein BFL38_11325 [Brachyspira hampsonii]|uniref:Lipoprotein n=1 Tax=Brachyspira hampsonii TaxID=1287055 RepID=A0A1E5NIP8_9SPIR|nr:hypothetical protein [Brachyspira hampsonii]OEJ16040.1 hypothetical protein BFL38_11325 [Brachyspira hampsonii]
MQKQIKVLLTLLIALFLAVSCAKNNPNNPTQNGNTDSGISGSGTTLTIQYGSKSIEVNTSDQTKLKELWVGLVANQFVYNSSNYSFKSGQFDAEGNYHDIGNDFQTAKPEIRTKYIKNVTYEYNGKVYLAGIYWDNNNTMPSAYRLIIIDETGVEQILKSSWSFANSRRKGLCRGF